MAENMLSFRWIVENFDMWPYIPDVPIRSSEMIVDCPGIAKFYLELYPRNDMEKDDDEYLSIYLVRHSLDSGPKYVFIRYEIALLDEDLMPTRYVFDDCAEFEKGSYHGKNNFIERNTLMKSNKSWYRNELIIQCKFALDDNNEEDYNPWSGTYSDLECLSSDIGRIFQESLHSDLNLRSADGVIFKVHKAVLLNRCPTILEASDLDSVEEINLPIESTTLRLLVKYLYSGAIVNENIHSIDHESLIGYAPQHLQQLLFPVPSTSISITKIRVKSASFRWIIPNFSDFRCIIPSLSDSSKDVKLIKTFCLDESLEWTKVKILMEIKQTGTLQFSVQIIACEEPIHMKCKIYATDSENVEEYENDFINETNWIIPHSLDVESLENTKYLESDTLKLFFDFKISDGRFMFDVKSTQISETTGHKKISNLWILQEDMKNLFEDERFADVTLCVENKRQQAHKLVLCARSPVFAKMFEHEMLGKESGSVFIKDVDYSVLVALLSFMYYGELNKKPEDIEFVCNLYAASDRYEILQLKNKCNYYFKLALGAENVGKILSLAYLHNDETLKNLVTEYVSSNWHDILDSREWTKTLRENSVSSREMQSISLAANEVGSCVVMSMLSCIYWQDLILEQKDIDVAIKIYNSACSYRISYLKKQCLLHFEKVINSENFGKLLSLADENNDDTIALCVENFVTSNLEKIVNSDEWKRIYEEQRDEYTKKLYETEELYKGLIRAYMRMDSLIIRLNIDKIKVSTVISWLWILYTGKLDKKCKKIDFLTDLYTDAKRFGLDLLIKECMKEFEKIISSENVGGILILADRKNDKDLKACVENFVFLNLAKILKSTAWKRKVAEKVDVSVSLQNINKAARELGTKFVMTILHFIYCGKLEKEENDIDSLIKLYENAKQYELLPLKEKCASMFDGIINEKTISRFLQFARTQEEALFRTCAENFVESNLEKILDSSEWKEAVKEKLNVEDTNDLYIAIKELGPGILMTLLWFIHCGELGKENDIDSVVNLYKNAEKYKLSWLKEKCIEYFKSNLSIGNVGILLHLSENHKDECLKKCVHEFVCTNAKEFIGSSELEKLKLENSTILHDLLITALAELANERTNK